jgi:hypothetical protein
VPAGLDRESEAEEADEVGELGSLAGGVGEPERFGATARLETGGVSVGDVVALPGE